MFLFSSNFNRTSGKIMATIGRRQSKSVVYIPPESVELAGIYAFEPDLGKIRDSYDSLNMGGK
jgi:hypothetical protein